jgi:hypothetical protein
MHAIWIIVKWHMEREAGRQALALGIQAFIETVLWPPVKGNRRRVSTHGIHASKKL